MVTMNKLWIKDSIKRKGRTSSEIDSIFKFWCEFYEYLFKATDLVKVYEESKTIMYKNSVLKVLDSAKETFGRSLSPEDLLNLQKKIEELTGDFDEESIYKTFPNLISMLIRTNSESAKDYLKSWLSDKKDMDLLSEFDQYTIEALIVHVLGQVFNSQDTKTSIRVATLVECLESSVRTQYKILISRRSKKKELSTDPVPSGKRSKMEKLYPIGSGLVQFMVSRELITLSNDMSSSYKVQNKNGKYYIPSTLFALCNFDISLLPIKLNLPMVCKPIDWKSASPDDQPPINLSYLSGGYLSSPTGEFYGRYNLLSTGDINHFYIDIGEDHDYKDLCHVMNKLQSQPFQINSVWLEYILNNEEELVDNGYLMPNVISSINFKEVINLLRSYHMMSYNEEIKKICSFTELVETLEINYQRARYERLIINLASAYNGFHFYLPAFLDFRGRIYRCGLLHFHERPLSRSLILFVGNDTPVNNNILDSDARVLTIQASISFYYKSFDSIPEALYWFKKMKYEIDTNLIEFARNAKSSYQLISNILLYRRYPFHTLISIIPITQDASASAYQIMSYFLMDDTLAYRTNLLPAENNKIQDVYSYMLEELKEFIMVELEEPLSTSIINNLTRKIVKGIFMPMIYGKTLMSTVSDLKIQLSHSLTYKDCVKLGAVCFKFWKIKYERFECLIRLIRNIGWFASSRNEPVLYRVPFFTTVQDYIKMVKINIWLYDSIHKKRHRVTLRVSSSNKDSRKTEISTFVNFIHQRDAHIAMKVVVSMLNRGAPIYTVHDNFISTAKYSNRIPYTYSEIIKNMGPPLAILNDFIYMNIMKPLKLLPKIGATEGYFSNRVITKECLEKCLRANVPENLSKKNKETWEKRITVIMISYENYTRYVCGDIKDPIEGWDTHVRRWEAFKSNIGSFELPNYCVHY